MLNVVAGLFSEGVPPIPPSTNSYESIATLAGTGSSGTISFTSIPSTFKHLQLRLFGLTASSAEWALKLNADAGVISHYVFGNGASVFAGNDPGSANGQTLDTLALDSTNPMVNVVDILDYTNTNKAKTCRWLGGSDRNGSGRVWLGSSLFTTTAAITSLTIYAPANFTTTSSFALYGIKG